MRKIVALIITLSIALTMFTACSRPNSDNGKIQVMTTIFPVYDWVCNILAGDDDFEISLLCDNGIDMHSYQPTAEDIVNISTCDVFIYVGGESDEWVDEVLANKRNQDMVVVNLLDVMGHLALPEDDDEPDEYDEHIWMSLVNASYVCTYLTEQVFSGLSSDPDKIRDNSTAYIYEFERLYTTYTPLITNASHSAFVVGDRYPFRYLSNDFGLTYYAAFDGCSAETEASFETVVNLADRLNEIGTSCVVVTESSDGNIADAIIEVAGINDATIVVLNSLQSVSRDEINSGVTYISLMEENFEVLVTVLG